MRPLGASESDLPPQGHTTMSIITADFVTRLSGGAANASGNAALGGAKSANAMSGSIDGLFDFTSGAESAAGDVEYRCVYLHNASVTDTMLGPVVWISANTPLAGSALAIGVGTAAVNGTEQTVANESTAPAGVTFSEPAAAGSGLAMGDLAAGQHKAIWLRRTITAGAGASANDTWSLGYQCETT
jgi:hypothetical protein